MQDEVPVFVGRIEELRRMRVALQEAQEQGGRLRVVFLAGEAGAGKTTLANHFLAEAKRRLPDVLTARGLCTTESELEGLAPFIQILDDLYEFSEQRTTKFWLQRLRDSQWTQFFKEVAPAWLDLITGGVISATKTTIEEGQKVLQGKSNVQDSLFGQFTRLLSEKASQRSLVVFIDDAQWIDGSSLQLLFHITRHLRDCPVLILVAYRPSEVAGAGSSFHTIRDNIIRNSGVEILLPTHGIDAREYARLRYPGHRFPEQFLEAVEARTRGYGLFVQQMFDWLEQTNVIQSGSGAAQEPGWFLAGEVTRLDFLPVSVQAALDSRLQQLTPEQFELLTYASVEGEEFTAQVILHFQHEDELKLLEMLEVLEQRYHLVKAVAEKSLGDATLSIFRFTHATLRERIYERLSEPRRRAMHGRVADSLAALYEGHLDLIAGQLARQYQLARRFREAATAYVQAAESAFQRYVWSEAVALARLALDVLEELPDDHKTLQQKTAAVLVWEDTCERTGEYAEVIPALGKVIAGLEQHEELAPQLVEALVALGWAQYYEYDHRAERTAWRALALAREDGGLELVYQAQELLSDVLVDNLGKYEQGREILEDQLEIVHQLGDLHKQADVLGFLAWCLAHLGAYREAVVAARQAIDLVERTHDDDLISYAFALRCAADALEAQGYPRASIRLVKQAQEIYERLQDMVRFHWCKNELAETYYNGGQLDVATPLFEDCLSYALEAGDTQQVVWNHVFLAETARVTGALDKAKQHLSAATDALGSYLGVEDIVWVNISLIRLFCDQGNTLKAREVAETTLPVLKEIQSHPLSIIFYHTLGLLAQAEGSPSEAATWYEESLQLSYQICGPQEMAQSHSLLGNLELSRDEAEKARRHFQQALHFFKALGHQAAVTEVVQKATSSGAPPDQELINRYADYLSPRYASILPLAGSYPSRYGTPTISCVDASIFVKRYFGPCLRCDFCHDSCCQHGVDIDVENVERIQQQAVAIERFTDYPRGMWFEPGRRSAGDYPGGAYMRTQVIDGACAFLNRSQRGCALHRFALDHGLDYHDFKPLISCIFPLTFDDGLLHPATEIYDESLICIGSGPTLYRALRAELRYYFGDEFVLELDGLEAGIDGCPH